MSRFELINASCAFTVSEMRKAEKEYETCSLS